MTVDVVTGVSEEDQCRLVQAAAHQVGPVAVPAHQDHHPAAQEAVLDLVVPAVLDQAEVPVPAVVVPRVVEAPEEEGAKEARKINLQLKISLKTKTRRVNQDPNPNHPVARSAAPVQSQPNCT